MARNCPIVSHIFFADDSLLFLHADERVPANIFNLLEEYSNASSQQINYNKSSVQFSPNT